MDDLEWSRRRFLRDGSAGAALLLLQKCVFPSLTLGELASAVALEQVRAAPQSGGNDFSDLLGNVSTASTSGAVDAKALFLGPKGENADLVERMLLDVYRDYIYWRRNFHSEDRPSVTPSDKGTRVYEEFTANFQHELFTLLGLLKSDIPFYSPRYMGHMISDVSLPALIGYFATMLYNPNNVSWEASPVTTILEIEAARELACMFGFGTTPEDLAGTWGHITSGGTVANIESLWVAKAVRFLPPAIRQAAIDFGVEGLIAGPDDKEIERMTPWELVNLPVSKILDLKEKYTSAYVGKHPELQEDDAIDCANGRLKQYSILSMGDHAFFSQLIGPDGLKPATMFAPQTMHYSWVKASGAVGIGAGQIVPIPIDEDFRMDMAILRKELERALGERRPVIAVVGVLGSTEEGAVDPIHEIVKIREEFASSGLNFHLHCDAAYGGYIAACFRSAAGKFRSLAEMRSEYDSWPSEHVYRGFAALKEADSITVDPHKLGFVPYPAGAIIFRDGRIKNTVAQEAAYALGGRTERTPGEMYIGKYILEGSKPGAAAAATYLSHRLIPLNERGYGSILGHTIRIARSFHDRVRDFGETIRNEFILQPLTLSDTNLVAYLFNPAGNTRLDLMNRFNSAIYSDLSIDPGSPVQSRQFILSHTELMHGSYNPAVLSRFLENKMKILSRYFVSPLELANRRSMSGTGYDSRMVVLRTTFMNLFTLDKVQGGDDYIQLFIKTLEPLLKKNLAVMNG
jgi:glutamate/tyrosine decarboxylase-like PLP-dependent enzyme